MPTPSTNENNPKLTQVRVKVKPVNPEPTADVSTTVTYQIDKIWLVINQGSMPVGFDYNSNTITLKNDSNISLVINLPADLADTAVFNPTNNNFAESAVYIYNFDESEAFIPAGPFDNTIQELQVKVGDGPYYQIGGYEQSPSSYERKRGYVVIHE